MTTMKTGVFCLAIAGILLSGGCSSMNKTQKGAVIGAAGGGVAGGLIGKAAGNTGLGVILGATVGGVAGGLIGHKMDKQAEEIKQANANVKVVRVGEGIALEFTDKVLFGYDSYTLNSTSTINLDKIVAILKKYPDTNIQVQGHTDNTGSKEYNQTLSEKRAASVSDYLLQQNILASRLSNIGFGETIPKYSNETADGQSQNRRVEFLITANEKMKADAKIDAAKKAGK